MIVDSQGLFWESQGGFTTATPTLSTNVIDLGVTAPKAVNWPASMGIFLNIESVNATTAIVINIETDSVATMDATPTVLAVVTLPATTVGRYFLGSLGPYGTMERFLALRITETDTGTGPVITAGLCMIPQTN